LCANTKDPFGASNFEKLNEGDVVAQPDLEFQNGDQNTGAISFESIC